jgi:hypothetical protein
MYVSSLLIRLRDRSLPIAAFASEDWHGFNVRDVMLFVGGVMFCLFMIRFMTANSPDDSQHVAPDSELGIACGSEKTYSRTDVEREIGEPSRVGNERAQMEG